MYLSRTTFAFNNDGHSSFTPSLCLQTRCSWFVHTVLFMTILLSAHFHATNSHCPTLSLLLVLLARLRVSSQMCCAAGLQLLNPYALPSAWAVLCVVILLFCLVIAPSSIQSLRSPLCHCSPLFDCRIIHHAVLKGVCGLDAGLELVAKSKGKCLSQPSSL